MWALFCDGEQVSEAYASEQDVWRHARASDLVDEGRLSENYEIRPIGDERRAAG